MNKRVFKTLAYLQNTPQGHLNKQPLKISSYGEDGKVTYGLHHYKDNLNDYIHFVNNYTLTDLRNISRLAEPLTGKVAIIDMASLVNQGMVNPAQKYILLGPGEQYQTFLHCFHKVKVDPKARISSEDLAAGVI